jgi:hypothetical protein
MKSVAQRNARCTPPAIHHTFMLSSHEQSQPGIIDTAASKGFLGAAPDRASQG